MGRATPRHSLLPRRPLLKHYADPSNLHRIRRAHGVQRGRRDCPVVKGGRWSYAYLDPKIYDGSVRAAKYAERCDDIGRHDAVAMMQAATAWRRKVRFEVSGNAPELPGDFRTTFLPTSPIRTPGVLSHPR